MRCKYIIIILLLALTACKKTETIEPKPSIIGVWRYGINTFTEVTQNEFKWYYIQPNTTDTHDIMKGNVKTINDSLIMLTNGTSIVYSELTFKSAVILYTKYERVK